MFIDDSTRIKHMLDSACQAVEFIKDHTREDLDTNPMLSLALVRLLEIIGEAAAGISQEFRISHDQLPWMNMIGMRNRLVHGYFEVNLDIVWKTMQEDLPPLIEQLRKLKT